MQKQDRTLSVILALLAIVSALCVGYLVVIALTDVPINPQARREVVLGASEEITATTDATTIAALPGADLSQAPTTQVPTPTFVPIDPTATINDPIVAPTSAPEPAPSVVVPTDPPPSVPTEVAPTAAPIPPTIEPTAPPPVVPTEVAPTEIVPTEIVPTDVPVAVAGTAQQVVLDDPVWQGGYKQTKLYGGRSATWIYGTGTDLSAMGAVWTLPAQPTGTAYLSIEGMDSEDRIKTPIRITINNAVMYEGANPLPNDDQPYETGTWATYTWEIDATYLQAGENTILIQTLVPGQFRQPPFFMLDYAVIDYTLP